MVGFLERGRAKKVLAKVEYPRFPLLMDAQLRGSSVLVPSYKSGTFETGAKILFCTIGMVYPMYVHF